MNYLCKTEGGYTFILKATKDYSKYAGTSTYISLGSDSFRIIHAIDILDTKDVVNLKVDYSLAG
tara:strand:- start:1316 stop:1507 length:192 start_codon:yes stop_codon:yes gene_type:complete